MSVEWWANGFIGCKIDNPYVEQKKRGCYHQEQNYSYCPTCGQPMWIPEKILSPVLESFKVGSIQHITNCDGDKHYVGLNLASVDKNKMEAKIDLKAIRDDKLPDLFKRLLKDLYKPENFGFWIILDAG